MNTIQTKKSKRLTTFDCMIADMFRYKKRNPIVRKLFIKGKKTKHFFVFITKSYFAVPKNILD